MGWMKSAGTHQPVEPARRQTLIPCKRNEKGNQRQKEVMPY